MSKAAFSYLDFRTPADILLFGDAQIADDKLSLSGVEATVIRASQFKTIAGAPNPMPVAAYGGHNVGNPANSQWYYFDFTNDSLGNAHSMILQLVETIDNHVGDQGLFIYPRANTGSYNYLRHQYSGRVLFFLYRDAINVNWNGMDYRKPAANNWLSYRIHTLNRYFSNLYYKWPGVGRSGFDYDYDPRLVVPGSPRGILRTQAWTQEEAYLRSPGRQFEDTADPAILELWPHKVGWAFPKNAANRYIEITQEIYDAIVAGTCFAATLSTPKARTLHLFSGTLDGTHSQATGFQMVGFNETAYGAVDGICAGGLLTFPDRPDLQPRRIVVALNNQLYTSEEIPTDAIVVGQRFDVWMCSVVPVFAFHPIDEEAPIFYALPYSENICDALSIQLSPPAVGTKIVFGIYITNYIDPQVNQECAELAYILDPVKLSGQARSRPLLLPGQMEVKTA